MRKMIYFKEVSCILGQTQKGKYILIVRQRRYTVTPKYTNFKILCFFLFLRVYFEPIESTKYTKQVHEEEIGESTKYTEQSSQYKK